MGATVNLRGSDFEPFELLGKFHEEVQEDAFSQLTQLGQQFYVEVVDQITSPDEIGELWLHAPGAIRGVTARFGKNEVELSLPTGSGAADWKLASKLANMAVAQGAEVEFEGEAVASDGEGNINLGDQFNAQWDFEVQAINETIADSDDGCIDLPVGGLIHLQVTAEDAARPDFHEVLVGKMAKYSAGYLAQTISGKNGSSEQTLQVVGAVPTLISGESVLVLARSAAEEQVGGFQKVMRTADFLEIMAERAEHLGPLIYVPEFDPEADSEIIKRLMEAPSIDKASPPPLPVQKNQQGLTDWESDILDRGPALIFIMIAAADGEIDRKEADCFSEILESFSDLPASLFKGILLRCLHDIKKHIDYYTSGNISEMLFMVELVGLGAAIDKCPEDQQQDIRNGLYTLGHKIASASGGGFLGLGSKIDNTEAATLSLIAKTLSVDPKSLDL